MSRSRGRNKGTEGNGPGGSLGNAKPDHVDIREATRIDGKLVVRLGWTRIRWTCGKRRMAVGENGFISRGPLRSCGGLKCGTRERDSTTPSSHKLLATPRNLLRPYMVDSACLLDSHGPRHQASPQSPTPDQLSFLGSSPSRTRVYTGN